MGARNATMLAGAVIPALNPSPAAEGSDSVHVVPEPDTVPADNGLLPVATPTTAQATGTIRRVKRPGRHPPEQSVQPRHPGPQILIRHYEPRS
jgi:hypothetical protein